MLKLIIEDDEGKTTVVPLIRDEITIGRKEGNTIRLTERNVSRRHARVIRQNGGLFVEDLNSYNGIKVNGSRIEGQTSVNEGDRIQIGDYVLALKQDQPAESAPADPFDEMKTIPVEKAEAQAMTAHLAQGGDPTPAAAAAAAPVPEAAPAATAQDSAAPQPRHQDLIDAAAQAASQAPPARLVVVSANFAGLECPLDKAAQVIGRTPDNDVVIDHRSVSKHHAKVVREEASYTVVDQGSANGVFVNGEKYDRVELRSGDMLDLGHVRLRFIAAGETFVFDPSMTVDTTSAADATKGAPIGLIVGAIVGVAALVAVLFATGVIGGKKKSPDAKAAAGGPAATATIDASAPASPTAGAAYRPIRDAIAQKDWKTAIREADSLLLKTPSDAEAKRLRQKAAYEQENLDHLNKFQENLRVGKLAPAVFQGTQVAKDSVYYAQVSKQLNAVKARFRKQLLADARRLSKAGDCDKLRALRVNMNLVAPGDTDYLDLLKSCVSSGSAVAMNPDNPPSMRVESRRHPGHRVYRPHHRARQNVTPPPDRRPPVRRPPARGSNSGKSAAQLLTSARGALMANQYGKAIRLARASIRKKWTSTAWGVLGVAACKAGRRSTAKQAYRALSGGYRSMLVSVCRQSGISLE